MILRLRCGWSVGICAFVAASLPGAPAAAQEQPAPSLRAEPAPSPSASAPSPAPVPVPALAPAPAPVLAQAPAPGVESKPPARVQIDQFVAEAYENDTETRSRAVARSRRALADRVEHVLGNFVDIGGYFRAGYGRDGRGGALAAFAAPGAAAKYRLGNEAENYGELIFGKSVYLPGAFRLSDDLRPDGTPSGPIARVQIRVSALSPYSTLATGTATNFGLPEAWASIGNVISALPAAKFWAGRRFFRRHDIHVLDFFYWDMSGGGGGVEDVQIGPAKLAFSWIGFGSTSGLGNVPAPDPANAAGFSKSSYELRVYELPLLGGSLEAGVTLATQRSGFDQSGRKAPSRSGVAVNLVHTVSGFISPEGTNKFSVQYGTGPAKTFNAGFETVDLPAGNFIRSVERNSWRIRVSEHFITNFGEHFSLCPILLFQATDQGDGTGRQYWYSAGARPTVHFNHYFSVAADGGVDYVRDTGASTSAALGKLTLAPQVAVGNRFDSRPVIRAFATAAWWGDDFRGKVGGADYSNNTHGFNAGMQMEAWW